MKKCWKVVVIMSNEFAKSDWCQWEVDFVQQRRRKKGKESFILIMLKSLYQLGFVRFFGFYFWIGVNRDD